MASPRSRPLRSARPTRHLEDSTTCRRFSTPRSTTTTSTSTGTCASACDVFPRASMRYSFRCTRRTAFAREVAGSPALGGTRDGHDGDAPRDIGLVRGPRYARYTRSSACVSIGTRRDVSAGAFPARASLGIAEPAAYPFEIGSPLTSLPPLPPSTDTSCFPPTSPSSCLRVACSPRYVSEPRYGSTPPPRPNAGDTEARCRNRIAAALDPLPRRLRGSSARLLAPRARVVRSARRN